MSDVIVIGGGIIGVTSAYWLASHGMAVTLLESAPELAAGASHANGAQLSYSYSDALGSPALLAQLAGLLLGRDPAFRVRPSLRPAFIAWGLRFLRECGAGRSRANTVHVLELALRSRTIINEVREREGIEFDYRPSGKLHLFYDTEALARARTVVDLKNAYGCRQEVLDAAAARACEPALAQLPQPLAGAVYSPLDEAGDACAFARTLGRRAAERYGVRIRTGVTVTALLSGNGRIRALRTSEGDMEAGHVVLSTGPQSARLAATARLRLPIVPMRGYSLTLPARPEAPSVSITDTARKIVFCRLGERLRIAGMADVGWSRPEPPAARIDALRSAARAVFPDAADYDAPGAPWAGLRPMTPDSRPLIGATAFPNLWLNCGHGMLGWTLACGSAERLLQAMAAGGGELAVAQLAV